MLLRKNLKLTVTAITPITWIIMMLNESNPMPGPYSACATLTVIPLLMQACAKRFGIWSLPMLYTPCLIACQQLRRPDLLLRAKHALITQKPRYHIHLFAIGLSR